MLFTLAAALLQAAVPSAAPTAPRPSVIISPDWMRKPTGADMAEFYPKAAAAAHIEGRATLHCKVAASGDLTDCIAMDENPLSQGFGDAALAMAGKFKMRPQTKDGVPVSGGQINIPIHFAMPRPQPPSAEVAMRCYGYAAAEAERNPTSQVAQAGTIAFSLLIEIRLVPENPRPSEVAELLASQRRIAEGRVDDPKFKSERDECATVMGSDPAEGMQRILSAIPR